MKEILDKLLAKQDLSYQEMHDTMTKLMQGKLSDIETSAFLIALRAKGESVGEIAASAACMQALATPVDINGETLVDIVGTGGDGQNTFNISTASAIVAASAGVIIAKHGNRSASSKSGSADVLECAGVNISLDASKFKACIEKTGIGFMFAPNYHPAMRHVIKVRQALRVRTLFNLLGPLTNPAKAKRQVIGVFDKQWLLPLAHVFKSLGSMHTLVVHSNDGLDEFSVFQKTHVAELNNGKISQYQLDSADYGLNHTQDNSLIVDSAEQSLSMILSVLSGCHGAPRDIVVLNAAATIYCAGLSLSIKDGVVIAKDALDSGKAMQCFENLKKVSHE